MYRGWDRPRGRRFTLIAIEGVLTWRWGRNIIVAFGLDEIVLNLRADEVGRVLEDRRDDLALSWVELDHGRLPRGRSLQARLISSAVVWRAGDSHSVDPWIVPMLLDLPGSWRGASPALRIAQMLFAAAREVVVRHAIPSHCCGHGRAGGS